MDMRDGYFHPPTVDPVSCGTTKSTHQPSTKDANVAASADPSTKAAAGAWGGNGDFSDAVLNALAAKRLDKDKMTHGQRLEAR